MIKCAKVTCKITIQITRLLPCIKKSICPRRIVQLQPLQDHPMRVQGQIDQAALVVVATMLRHVGVIKALQGGFLDLGRVQLLLTIWAQITQDQHGRILGLQGL